MVCRLPSRSSQQVTRMNPVTAVATRVDTPGLRAHSSLKPTTGSLTVGALASAGRSTSTDPPTVATRARPSSTAAESALTLVVTGSVIIVAQAAVSSPGVSKAATSAVVNGNSPPSHTTSKTTGPAGPPRTTSLLDDQSPSRTQTIWYSVGNCPMATCCSPHHSAAPGRPARVTRSLSAGTLATLVMQLAIAIEGGP